MRSHEERIAETKRRIAETKRKKAFAVAACLVLLVSSALALPGVVAPIGIGDRSGLETAASLFGDGAALGYIVIGLLAFLLGVCVTILCFRLRSLHREEPPETEKEDRHGAD